MNILIKYHCYSSFVLSKIRFPCREILIHSKYSTSVYFSLRTKEISWQYMFYKLKIIQRSNKHWATFPRMILRAGAVLFFSLMSPGAVRCQEDQLLVQTADGPLRGGFRWRLTDVNRTSISWCIHFILHFKQTTIYNLPRYILQCSEYVYIAFFVW